MKFLIVISILIHIAFLFSIFYIYFKSIIVKGLSPLKDSDENPAKRLVLIVGDGLRAESFFRNECGRVHFLRDIIINKGMVGVSHTHVPTESRPGHVALIAGVYEDPSAILKGWKENLVEFDSVFNRSHKTYSFGSPDIVPIFAKGATKDKVYTEVYKASDEQFGGGTQTHLLDQWVFDRVKHFLGNRALVENLKKENKIIFFLHLLGLDTSGHVHKPHSKLFSENLKFVDNGIEEMMQLFEETFDHDEKTAYIFTSDHGMTDRGSHGSGQAFETETPFVAWGAGVNYWRTLNLKVLPKNFVKLDGERIPLFDMEQADITPLMSAILGTAVPVNNVGKMPYIYLNSSEEYLANAVYRNAYQLYAQYQKMREQSLKKIFKISFSYKENEIEEEINFLDENIKLCFTMNDYNNVTFYSSKMIDYLRKGIEFYQNYYKYDLLIALTLTMIGWIIILCQYVLTNEINYIIKKRVALVGFIVTVVIIIFNLIQRTPAVVVAYFILPIPIWMVVLKDNSQINAVKRLFTTRTMICCIILCLLVAEVSVFSFFQRKVLSAALFSYSLIITLVAMRRKIGTKMKIIKYFSSSVCLGIFPLLPTVEKDTKHSFLLILGTIFWIFKSLDYVYLKRYTKVLIVQSLLMFTGGLFFLHLVVNYSNHIDIGFYQQIITWIMLISPALVFLGGINIELRLKAIGNALCLPFILMSLSYEPLFLLSYFINLFNWIEVEMILYNRKGRSLKDLIYYEPKLERKREISFDDLRIALIFMLYLLVGFFSTGNLASISSFDPNWVRFLVTTFSPFLMTTLIIFKLMIPLMILACILRTLHLVLRINAHKQFIFILIVCDIMCLNFLFLVKNKGSWLDIGTSFSHFIIMECTVLILIVLYGFAHLLTSFQFRFKTPKRLRQ